MTLYQSLPPYSPASHQLIQITHIFEIITVSYTTLYIADTKSHGRSYATGSIFVVLHSPLNRNADSVTTNTQLQYLHIHSSFLPSLPLLLQWICLSHVLKDRDRTALANIWMLSTEIFMLSCRSSSCYEIWCSIIIHNQIIPTFT